MGAMESAIFWTTPCIIATANVGLKLYQNYPNHQNMVKSTALPIAVAAFSALNAIQFYAQLNTLNCCLAFPISFFCSVPAGCVLEMAIISSRVLRGNGLFFSCPEVLTEEERAARIRKTIKSIPTAAAVA